jgi:hypothetical protein
MSVGISQIYNKVIRNIPIFEVTAALSTNQPTNDQFEIVSNSTSDTQKITVWYTDTGDTNTIKYETFTLNGTTAVGSASTIVENVIGAFLGERYGDISKRAVGTITIRKKTGALAISTITAGKLSTGTPYFYLQGNNVKVENIAGNTWINSVKVNGLVAAATSTGACTQLTGRMERERKVDSFLSLVSDGTGSTVQIIVFEQ